MATAQMMQDELQESVLLSEEDGEFNHSQRNALSQTPGDDYDEDLDAEGEDDDGEYEEGIYATGAEDDDGDAPGEDDEALEEDADGQSDNDDVPRAKAGRVSVETDGAPCFVGEDGQGEADDEDDEDEDDEGVGAVKIKPGDVDDEDSDSSGSGGSSDDESDAWEEPAENEEEDDEESKNEPLNTCLFCKLVEDNASTDESGPSLRCSGCGDNAHRQCAQEQTSFNDRADASSWRCPECIGNNGLASDDDSADDARIPKTPNGDGRSPPMTRRSTATKLESDLLPSLRGTQNPDSHSVFNHLVMEEDPMDGSRMLRKRKTSSADVDAEEIGMSLRKRRRNTAEEVSTPQQEEPSSMSQPPRSLRLQVSTSPDAAVVVEKKTRKALVVRFKVDPASLQQILSQIPKPKKPGRGDGRRTARGGATRGRGRPPKSSASTAVGPPFVATGFMQPFYSFLDKDTDELKGKPYGGILTEAEADTQRTLPTPDDRRRFDEAKQKAEEEWRARVLEMQAEACIPVKKTKKTVGPASQIECIQFGGWEIDTWYAAPYPEEYSRNRVLYICEFCLKYMNSDYVAWRHKLKCPAKNPPGDEIYRKGSVSFFEVDGRKNPVYCQNLCLLAKLFLGSKTLYYDVEPFLFYVLCEYDDHGYHFVGYFSKEKRVSSQNNVSCILTLPIHQRKGYGNLLIDFSYLLTRVEKKTGSPEKPLSDMGLVSYRNYWRLVLCRYFANYVSDDGSAKQGMSIKKISKDTGMTADDVVSALEGLRFLVRDPQTGVYAFRVDMDFCRAAVAKWLSKGYVTLQSDCLTWTPYVMARGNTNSFELGPALTAIAPREEEQPSAAEVAVSESAAPSVPGDAKTPNGVASPSVGGDPMTVDPAHAEAKPSEGKQPVPSDGKAAIPCVPGTSVEEEDYGQEVEREDDDKSSEGEDVWLPRYENIPATRFQVFPPISARRDGRGRPPGSKAGGARTPRGSTPRTGARRSVASSRRSSAAPKPKRSPVRRKAGGTGRGPGRWPKGTKKADYGNADSGPGLPPGWTAEQEAAAQLEAARLGKGGEGSQGGVVAGDVKENGSMSDGMPLGSTPRRRGSGASSASASSAISYGDGKGKAGRGRQVEDDVPLLISDIKGAVDVDMEDEEDVDA